MEYVDLTYVDMIIILSKMDLSKVNVNFALLLEVEDRWLKLMDVLVRLTHVQIIQEYHKDPLVDLQQTAEQTHALQDQS